MFAFRNLPAGNIRVPGDFFEVQSDQSNGTVQPAVGLIIGQLLPTGSKVTTVPTSAASASGEALTFASAAAIQNVVPSPFLLAIDRTNPEAIPADTYVASKLAGTITLSNAVTSVGSGDSIQFIDTKPFWMNSQTNAVALFGAGSMLARMDAQRRANDPFGVWYCMPLPDDPASVAATGQQTFVGTVTSTSVLALYVDFTGVPVVVTSGMTAAQVATAVAAAVNANPNLPVTASASSGNVTYTAKNAGLAGNDADIRLNYYGPSNNEFTPPGLIVTPAAGPVVMSGGATDPYAQMTASFLTLPTKRWGAVAFPYGNDVNALNALATFMGNVTGLWSWAVGRPALAFGARRDTLGNSETALAARNDPFTSIMPNTNSPTSSDEWSAAIAAAYLQLQRAQPGANSNGTALEGVGAPAATDQFDIDDQNALLYSGGSTFEVAADGTVSIQKLITTYQNNPITNTPDDDFLQIDDMARIAYALSYMQVNLALYRAGKRLAQDGTRFGPGVPVVTPSLATQKGLGLYQDLVTMGICEDTADFQAGFSVQINPNNTKELDWLWPGIIVGDYDINAILMQPVTN